ncbi:hypothetical protein LIER_39348 [Lithospermum erythrorhizon]|uniref:Retrovirus-related Pol polyprotein from transposon TNT 1-94 n=1 Tax=Lithospermum erythrorhizon TaxID=34254 RepID=A0AAV3QFZ4_LITER
MCKKTTSRFEMSESNPVCNPIVLGTKVDRDAGGNIVNKPQYKQIVSSLMYLTSTRPNIMFVTNLISRYMSRPTKFHLQLAKRILRYLKGTTEYDIFYKEGTSKGGLLAYTDTITQQPIVTLSTTEAEFVAATACTCQAIWMMRILKELNHEDTECIQINCDNSSTIKLSKNPIIHGRSKHIDVRYHFLRDLTNEGVIALIHCGSTYQVADIMTKPVKIEAFQKQRASMEICTMSEII